jgi:tetratricopeptide (TPR) repeat protein
MKRWILAATFFLCIVSHAADTPSNMEASLLNEVREHIQQQAWETALRKLSAGVREDPTWSAQADFHNLMGFVLRHQTTKDMDLVIHHYDEALRLDPTHVQAREYLGEAWLMLKQPNKAIEQLQAIERLCGNTRCAEWKDLREALNRYQP